MNITNDIRYIGVNDHGTDLFEGQYDIPFGISYNSYVILDEKIAVMDSVEEKFGIEWLNKIKSEIGDRSPDYLIVHHMEPDHSANIVRFMLVYPKTVIVATEAAFKMLKNFYRVDFSDRRIVAEDGFVLSLGKHVLTFITAPMVHWPEVMTSYDSRDKAFFSADAFGKFGALDLEEDWACEARRYYFGIMGKYGSQVHALLRKIENLDIQIICPLHGPVLDSFLDYYFELYNTWSEYEAENDGVLIAYTSVYGNTKKASKLLAKLLEAQGCENVVLTDLARSDMSEAVEDAFRYDRLVLATTTYNGSIFPCMKEFIGQLVDRGFKNRTIGLIENGSWAPQAAGIMKKSLECCRNLRFLRTTVTIRSSVSNQNKSDIIDMANELMHC